VGPALADAPLLQRWCEKDYYELQCRRSAAAGSKQGAQVQKTHYDILKVARDAPIEVIRAAYRALSQKHHPDRRPEDSAAADTMGLLNQAYEVLTDPERRRAHDAWIRQVEAESSHVRTSEVTVARPARVEPERGMGSHAVPSGRVALRLWPGGIVFGSVLLVSVGVVVVLSLAPGPQLGSWTAATPALEDREAYIRRLAREVVLWPGDGAKGSPAVPTGPDTAASPSDDSPTSATQPATPAEGAQVPSDHDAAWPNDAAGAAMHPEREARSTLEFPSPSLSNEAELPSVSQPGEPELPSVSQPDENAADRAPSSSESQQGSMEAVAGSE
jgi:hypothetical protein